jgi:hypothetical protein
VGGFMRTRDADLRDLFGGGVEQEGFGLLVHADAFLFLWLRPWRFQWRRRRWRGR